MRLMERFKNKLNSYYQASVRAKNAAKTAVIDRVKAAANKCVDLLYIIPGVKNAVRAYRSSYEVRTVIGSAVYSNFAYYATPVVLYEGIMKPLFVSRSAYEDEVDSMAQFAFYGLFVCMFVNNTLYNISLKKTLAPFVAPANRNGCDCSAMARTKANLADSFHYIGNILSGSITSWVPNGVAYLTQRKMPLLISSQGFILKAMAYGFCFVGIKYSFHNFCATHTKRLLNNSKIYCFVTGAVFIRLAGAGTYLLNLAANTQDNFFLDDVSTSLMTQLFIMLSLLQEREIPAEEAERDFFYYQQQETDRILTKVSTRLISSLAQKGTGKLSKSVNELLDTRVAQWTANTRAISLFLDLHQDNIKSVLNGILEARGYPLWIVDYLPRFITSDTVRIATNLLKQEGWKDTQDLVNKLLKIAENSRDLTESRSRYFLFDRLQPIDNYIERGPNPPEEVKEAKEEEPAPAATTAETTDTQAIVATTASSVETDNRPPTPVQAVPVVKSRKPQKQGGLRSHFSQSQLFRPIKSSKKLKAREPDCDVFYDQISPSVPSRSPSQSPVLV